MRRLAFSPVRAATAAAVALASTAIFLGLRHHSVALAAYWSMAMLASFVGWGSLANLWLAPDRRMDAGLRAGWGMALFILTGGFLSAAHLAVRPVLMAQVGVGVLALLGLWAHRPTPCSSATRWRRRVTALLGRSGMFAVVAGVYAMAVFTLVAFLGNHRFQLSDDPPLYFTLAEDLVQTGSLFQPYAARRISSLGGQVYLHAAFISVAPIYYLHVVDAGISLVVVAALVVGHVGRSGLKPWHAVPIGLAALVLFTLQNVRVNTASLMSGVAATMTLYRTVRVPFGRDSDRPLWPIEPRRALALAGCAVVPILLRTSNAAAVLPFVVLVFASDFLLGVRKPWTRESLLSLARTGGIFAAAFLLLLSPWSIMLRQSSGTFFFPFGHNNLTPGWTFLAHPSSLTEEFVVHLYHGKPLALFVPFVVAGLVPLPGRARNDLTALTVATLVGLLAQSWQSAAFGADATARYYFAYVAATAVIVAMSVGRNAARAALAGVAVAGHVALTHDDTRDALSSSVANAIAAIDESSWELQVFDAKSADYLEVQSYIPPHVPIATAVLEPFRFDFQRNVIYVLDTLGGMGPKPGWPLRQGPEALGGYFLANGVRYLVSVDFNLPGEFYNKAHWTSHLSRIGSYLQGEAIVQLDAEDAIEKLTAAHLVVYSAHGMTVVDLAQPPAP
ncbi:MAG: hypothetical protein ACLP1X_04080 [Polyangiaceae bacterium]|jgi:hypothetical protein